MTGACKNHSADWSNTAILSFLQTDGTTGGEMTKCRSEGRIGNTSER